jgi:hypothetical protein
MTGGTLYKPGGGQIRPKEAPMTNFLVGSACGISVALIVYAVNAPYMIAS